MKKNHSVHGGGTRKNASRRKKELALALCVSLWMAGGSIAEAANIYIDTMGNLQIEAGVVPTEPVHNGKYLTITGGNWNQWGISGGADVDKSLSGYHLTLTGAVIGVVPVRGAYTEGDADVTNNYVDVTDCTGKGRIRGGESLKGNATDNHVTLTNVTLSGADSKFNAVYGGHVSFYGKVATDNSITMTGANVGAVIGGYGANTNDTSHNTVILKGGNTINGNLMGGFGNTVTGNTLNLSGANNIVNVGSGAEYDSDYYGGKVKNFEAINIKGATWGTPVLKLNGAGLVQNGDGNWATIDAGDIVFSGVDALKQGQTTTLIQGGMTNYDGTIKSGKYKIGTTLQGTGTASKQNADLIYTIDTPENNNGGGPTAREQTHNTVMGAEVGMAALSVGNDFVGAATESLSLASNIGADGVSSFAQMGGGSMRQETGSHIDSHTWNAIIALGHANKKARGTFEYGAFFEYGSGNYTTFAEGGLRGDGSSRYTGGGLLAKYTTKDSVYVEGSLRAGSIHDDARNVLRDGAGNPYSYETDAPYMGFHLGVGKEIPLSDGNAVDVYGKYFYNRRNSVDFNAGGHYDLDAVTSSVIRVGARYIVKRDKWNFYAGAAYEHELDGKANGTADGVAIRGADISGGSFRGELGATMTPGENSPWKLDLNVTGFAGKKQGFTGGVSVAFMF